MQQSPEVNPTAATFASLLAALAAPAPKSEPEWEDEPAEELTSLSYESALKAHALYRPASDPAGLPPRPPVATAPEPAYAPIDFPLADFNPSDDIPAAPRVPAAARTPEPPLPKGKLKTASITIRMSEDECAQLRHRAEEAGMTISSYLRSCTFEAESLRAQVKEAMAELRAATLAAALAAKPAAPAPAPEPLAAPRRSWRHMVERLMPNGQQLQHAARA